MNLWKSILSFGLSSTPSNALTHADGVKHTILIDSLGLWSHVNNELNDKDNVLVASNKTSKVAKLSVETGQTQWTFDTAVYLPNATISGINSVLDKDLAVVVFDDDSYVALSVKDGKPLTSYEPDDFDQPCDDKRGCQVISEYEEILLNSSGITIYNDGRIEGPSNKWSRDESLGSVITSTLLVDYKRKYTGFDISDNDEFCTDPGTMKEIQSILRVPVAIDSHILGAVQPITIPVNDEDGIIESCADSDDLLVLSGAPDRLSLLCRLHDSVGIVMKESWSLKNMMCPLGSHMEESDAMIWRLSDNEFVMEYSCYGGERFLNTFTLNGKGSLSVGQNPKALSIHSELISNGQSLFLVNRDSGSIGGEVSLEKISDYSKSVKHALQADESTNASLYVVKDTYLDDHLMIAGYSCDITDSGNNKVVESWNIQFPHTELVQKIDNIERKRALGSGIRFIHSSLVTKNDGTTIETYPVDILSLYIIKDIITSRIKIIGINSFTGELVTTYMLPDTIKTDAKIVSYRSNNKLFILYKSTLDDRFSGPIQQEENKVDLLHQVDVVELVSDIKFDPWNLLLASFGMRSSPSKTSFVGLPYDLPSPLLMARTYIIPYDYDNIILSQSELGITPKFIFINTSGDNIHAIPSFMLNARRPRANANTKLEPGQTEDGLSLYHPLVMASEKLPLLKPFHSISSYFQGKKCQEFISFPVMGLESASLFIAASKGLFGIAVVHPAGKFDHLPFSEEVKIKVSLCIVTLMILIIGAKVYNRYSKNKRKWL